MRCLILPLAFAVLALSAGYSGAIQNWPSVKGVEAVDVLVEDLGRGCPSGLSSRQLRTDTELLFRTVGVKVRRNYHGTDTGPPSSNFPVVIAGSVEIPEQDPDPGEIPSFDDVTYLDKEAALEAFAFMDSITGIKPRWALDFSGSRRELEELGHFGLSPGWASFGVALPQGAATTGLRLGSLETQTDVRVRWPDGSIRHAIVTGRVTGKGTYLLREAAPPSGSFRTSNAPPVEVEINGATFSPAVTAPDWFDGPLMNEYRSEFRVSENLRILFDVRSYVDGVTYTSITVENPYNHEAGTHETYDLKIRLADQEVFARQSLTHYYLTRWRKTFWHNGNASKIVLDLEPYQRAGALPRWRQDIPFEKWDFPTVDDKGNPRYDILGYGDNSTTYMPGCGGRSEIGPYPDGIALWTVYPSPQGNRYVRKNGDLFGSYPVHLLDPDGSFVTIDKYPDFWWTSRVSSMKGIGYQNKEIRKQQLLTPDTSHVPSWAYPAYLITGDRYHLEEQAYWTNYCLLFTAPYKRHQPGFGTDGSHGLFFNIQERGIAWALRLLIDLVAYAPDSWDLRPYFAEKLDHNLEHLDHRATAQYVPAIGTFPVRGVNTGERERTEYQHQYIAFLGWTLHRAHEQGFAGGQKLAYRIAGFAANLVGQGSGWPRKEGVPNGLTYRQVEPELDWYETAEELWDRNQDRIPRKGARDSVTSFRNLVGIFATRFAR